MAKSKVPPITHAEVQRRIQREVELCGSISLAARSWRITPQLLSYILSGQRSVGPKLLKALKLRRKRYVLYRYEEIRRGES
jgi:hypothetical protein